MGYTECIQDEVPDLDFYFKDKYGGDYSLEEYGIKINSLEEFTDWIIRNEAEEIFEGEEYQTGIDEDGIPEIEIEDHINYAFDLLALAEDYKNGNKDSGEILEFYRVSINLIY